MLRFPRLAVDCVEKGQLARSEDRHFLVEFVVKVQNSGRYGRSSHRDALDASAPAGLYGYQPDPATAAYPLALISPASERTISSMLSELPRPEVRLLMHPDDAAVREQMRKLGIER